MKSFVSLRRSVGVWVGVLAVLLALAGCEEDTILEMAWSPDGRWLAYVQGESVYVAAVTPARALRARRLEGVAGKVPDAHLSWSSSSREFLFTSTAGGGWDIWRAQLSDDDLWGVERLTVHPAKDWGAVFAPDGRRFGFLSYRGGQCDLWLKRLAGEAVEALTDDPGDEWALSFGVDRALLYYVRTVEGGVSQLRAVDLNSRVSGVVAEGLVEVSEVVASPVRHRVAVVAGADLTVYSLAVSSAPGPGRVIARARGSRLGSGHDVAWSSVGDTVTFVDEADQVRVAAFDGGRPSWDRKFAGRLPRLGPDDRRLAWVLAPGSEHVGVPDLAREAPGHDDSVTPELILIGQLPLPQYQCIYSEERTLLVAARRMAALGDFEGEAALLEALLGARPPGEADRSMLSAYAFALAKVGRTEEALGLARSQLRDDTTVGILALAYAEDDAAASRALMRSEDPWAVGVALVLEGLEGSDRGRLRKALRSRVEGRGREALTAYQELRDCPLSPAAEVFVTFEVACLEEALGRSGQALGSFRWVVRNAPGWSPAADSAARPSQVLGGRAAYRASLLAERLGLVSETVDFARLHSLSAATVGDRFASRLNQVRLGLASGSPTDRQEALTLVDDVLVPTVADGGVGSKDGLAAAWVLDLYGEHEKANAVLAAVFAIEGEGRAALPGLVSALHWLPEEAVFEVRPAAAPAWLIRRLELASQVLVPERRRLVDGLLGLATGADVTPADVEDALAGLQDDGERQRARMALDYIAGNRALNDGRTAEAAHRFAELLELEDRHSDAQHFLALEEAAVAESSAENLESITGWILALRESRSVMWAEAAAVVAEVTALVDPAESRTLSGWADRLPRAPRLKDVDPEMGRAALAAFERTHPGWPLPDAVAYYRAVLLTGQERAGALRRFLHEYPDTVFWDEAAETLVEDLEGEGEHWLAAQWLEELLTVRPQARVGLLRRIARLYRARLAEPTTAVIWAKQAAAEARGTEAWPGAQHALVVALGEAGLWSEQAEAAALLVGTAEESEWVRDGGALMVRAQALERSGDWKEAARAYMEFVEKFPRHEDVQNGRLLARIIPHLSLSDLRRLYGDEPERMGAALPGLNRGERERVLRLVPELGQVPGRR